MSSMAGNEDTQAMVFTLKKSIKTMTIQNAEYV